MIGPAIEALTTMAQGVVPEDVQVFDGPPVTDAGLQLIAFGVEVTQETGIEGFISTRGLNSEEEVYNVGCLVDVVSGDDDLPGVRAQASELFNTIRAMIRDNRTLNGVVSFAEITNTVYHPVRNDQGVAASILFTVRVKKN